MNEDRVVDIAIIVIVIGIIAAKLTGFISISWLWLTAIIWIPLAIGFVIAFLFILTYCISCIIDKIKGVEK